MRRNITIAVLGTVLLAVGAPAPAGAQAGGAASASTVKAFTKRLAQVGIPTYRPGSRKPVVRVRGRVSPVQLTTDLARSAALGAQLRSGMTAGQLDATTGPLRLGTTSIPGGALVVAWAKGTDTRSARLARTLLGPVDWSHYEQIVLPHAVMLLFSSDVALHLPQRPAKRRAAKRTVAATAAAAPVPGGPCTATRDFIENTVNKVFNAIGHVRTDHATINRIFGGFFGKIIGTAGDVLSFGVNTAIDGARKIVLGATRIPVKLVTDAIAGVAATVSVVSQVANGIMPWKGAHTIDATPKRKGGVPGTLTLTVTAPVGEIPYPDWVKNCASVFEFPLPSFTPKNSPSAGASPRRRRDWSPSGPRAVRSTTRARPPSRSPRATSLPTGRPGRSTRAASTSPRRCTAPTSTRSCARSPTASCGCCPDWCATASAHRSAR